MKKLLSNDREIIEYVKALNSLEFKSMGKKIDGIDPVCVFMDSYENFLRIDMSILSKNPKEVDFKCESGGPKCLQGSFTFVGQYCGILIFVPTDTIDK